MLWPRGAPVTCVLREELVLLLDLGTGDGVEVSLLLGGSGGAGVADWLLHRAYVR